VLAAVASNAHGPLDTVAGLPTGAAVALVWVLVVDAGAVRSWDGLGRRKPSG
jgi:hypothetical protein